VFAYLPTSPAALTPLHMRILVTIEMLLASPRLSAQSEFHGHDEIHAAYAVGTRDRRLCHATVDGHERAVA